MTCKGFAEETASESPAPGGGSIAAYERLGAALGTMVANLSSHKAGWDDRWEEFSDWADRGQALLGELLHLVDEDTAAFNRIMAVFAMPKSTDEEKAARSAALQEATLYATQVPLRTMKTAFGVSKSCVPWQPSATLPRCPTRASGAGRPQRRAGRRPQCPDQCRRAERPCRGRCARGRSRPPCGRGRTGRARGVGDSSK